jgi:hypothetical protein
MMKGQARAAFTVIVAVAAACASPNTDRDIRYQESAGGTGPLIEVKEFELTVPVIRYEADDRWLSVAVAQQLVRHLRTSGRRAVIAASDAPNGGELIVRGRVVKADGGNKNLRRWVGMGAGPTAFGVSGEIVLPSGEVVGRFADERRSTAGLSSIVTME